jgi:hypothetical protein
MRRQQVIAAAVMALALCGCVLRKKQSARAVPPPPKPASAPTPAQRQLSVPQTQVVLPPPQPVAPEALETAPPPPATVNLPAPARTNRRAGTVVGPQPRPEPPPQQAPQPAATPASPEPERPAIGEIVPAEEQKRLQSAAQEDRRAIRQIVEQVLARGLSKQDRNRVTRVEQFVKLSDEAEAGGNMRQAYELARRGLILARELTLGR